MPSLQNVDLSEYHSFLTYYGMMPTGTLSESDLDYLVFRLKIFSTSQNAKPSDHPHTPPLLFDFNLLSTKCEQSVSQLLRLPTTSPADPDPYLDEWPAASTLSTTKFHTCDFNDDMSPCWNRRCELWEGINDGQSWLWRETYPHTSDSTTTKAHIEKNSHVDVEHGAPSIN